MVLLVAGNATVASGYFPRLTGVPQLSVQRAVVLHVEICLAEYFAARRCPMGSLSKQDQVRAGR
jgi:hypothetical protein